MEPVATPEKSEIPRPYNPHRQIDISPFQKLSREEASRLTQGDYNRWGIQPNANYGYSEDYGIQLDPSALHNWLHIICLRKWLIIIITAVVSLLVAFMVYRTKPTYQATTIVEVGKENTAVIQISKDLIIQNDDTIKTKKFILQSTPLLEDVVVNLQLDRNPGFLGTRKKWFWDQIESATGNLNTRDQTQGRRDIADTAPLQEPGELMRPPEESERLEPFVKMIEENLTIEEIRETRLLNVSFTHTDPVIAAAVSNGVVQTLLQRNFDAKTEKFIKASSWVDRQTRDLKTKVDQTEQELASYSREHHIVSTDGSETVTADKLTRLHGEVMRAETDRIVKQSLYEEVKNGHVEQIPEAFTNAATVELKTKLNELATKAAQLDVNYGPDNPQTIEVQQQIVAVQKQTDANSKMLEAKLKTDYERAVRDERSLKGVLDQAKAEAVQQNQTAIRYSILKQQFDTAKAVYADFLQKTNQAGFEASQQSNNLRVIQPARLPKETSGPKRWQIMIMGFMLSIGTGVGLAFLVERFDKTIKTSEQIRRHVQLPALGIIPPIAPHPFPVKRRSDHNALPGDLSMKSAGESILATTPFLTFNGQSPAAEAYRVLRTAVLLPTLRSMPKTILITSGQPGDGKTTTTVNTAISLAELGASVLIIDCDLRTPKVHELLGVDQSPGLSTCLSSDLKVEDAILELQIPNLSLLPSGPVPLNPSELVSSERMKDLLRMLAERYDHILIDSPPLINLADPLILSTKVDGVILVVYGGKTTCDAAVRSREELLGVGANIFGVVLNNFDLRRERYGYY